MLSHSAWPPSPSFSDEQTPNSSTGGSLILPSTTAPTVAEGRHQGSQLACGSGRHGIPPEDLPPTKAQPPSGPDSEDICYPWLPVQPTQTDRMGIPVHTPSLSVLIHAAGRRTFKRITTCPAVPRNPGPGTGALRLLWARRKLPASSDLLWEWPENVCKYLINPCYIIF